MVHAGCAERSYADLVAERDQARAKVAAGLALADEYERDAASGITAANCGLPRQQPSVPHSGRPRGVGRDGVQQPSSLPALRQGV